MRTVYNPGVKKAFSKQIQTRNHKGKKWPDLIK